MRRFYFYVLLTIFTFGTAQAEVVGKEVDYQAGDTTLKGYIAYDNASKAKRPGILVVHEWWGHNEYARKRARMLAEMGYVALAVDMYGDGKQAAHPEDAQKFSSAIANDMPLARKRFDAALNLLKEHKFTDARHIAAIGYCFGGAVVLNMARQGVDLDAVASFHGSLANTSPAQPDQIKARIMVAHGGADPFVTPEQLTGFIDEMNKANAYYRLHIYSGAKHSFTNPDADTFGKKFDLPLQYNAAADEDSWRDLKVFLKQAFAD